MQVTIRAAGPVDAPLLSELGVRTFRDNYSEFNDPDDLESHIAEKLSVDYFRRALAGKQHHFYLLFVDEQAAGFTQLTVPAHTYGRASLEVHRFYVLQEYQGRRLGTTLMRQCITFARENGYRSLWLGVWKENSRAIAFYRKMGFRITGEHIFQLGSDAQKDWVMTLDL